MQFVVGYEDAHLELDLLEANVIGNWLGPTALSEPELKRAVDRALDEPLGRPGLGGSVVPGDHVTIAIGATTPAASAVIAAIVERLESAGVSRADVTILLSGPDSSGSFQGLKDRLHVVTHEPEDRANLAYLAASKTGKPIYLNRLSTDADVVIAIDTLRSRLIPPSSRDRPYRATTLGPDSLIYPGLSEKDPDHGSGVVAEVDWLLGSPLQIGVVPAREGGISGVIAGTRSTLRDAWKQSSRDAWTIHAGRPADLVIAGVGSPESPSTLSDVIDAALTGSRLIDSDGRVVILSKSEGPIGPALRRLRGMEHPGEAAKLLRGAEKSPDYSMARALGDAMRRTKLYLLSRLDPDEVEELGIVPLEKPAEAARIARSAKSIALISRADYFRISRPKEEAEDAGV
jgi:Lactate racemase N-terminal domain